MPIRYFIDHEHRLVVAQGLGVFTARDMFDYQREVWSRPDVAGYDELVDMTRVERIDSPSASGVQSLAALSASMDPPDRKSKFAIVAPQSLAFGLGRMYQTHRNMEAGSTKEVGVFWTLADALIFLGYSGRLPLLDGEPPEIDPNAETPAP